MYDLLDQLAKALHKLTFQTDIQQGFLELRNPALLLISSLHEKRTRKCTFPQKDNTPFSECLHKPGLVKSIFLVGRSKEDVKIQSSVGR